MLTIDHHDDQFYAEPMAGDEVADDDEDVDRHASRRQMRREASIIRSGLRGHRSVEWITSAIVARGRAAR